MSQEIKIPVSAQTSSATSGIQDIGKATQGVSDAAADLAKNTKAAADNMTRLEAAARRLATVRGILSREFGKPVDGGDATMFLHNFEKMKTGGSIFGRRLRGFDNFENWYSGHSGMYRDSGAADRHRRTVMALGMQNTGYSQNNGTPAYPPPPSAPPPRTPPGPSGRGASGIPGASTAMSFGKGMLAISGITSVMGMLGQAVDMATEESVGIDTLKRKMGDLGVSYDTLRDSVRNAAEGMGMTYVEAQRLANQMAKITGTFNAGDLRTSIGFARSFGMDPSQTGSFFAGMRQVGEQGSSDQDSRKFAALIADAIQQGGWPAKADEVLSAVSSFTSTAVRMSLSRPDVPEYAAYLSGLTSMGSSYGMTPDAAGGILSQANSTFMRGGGRGQASQNFIYQALAKSNPGMNPLMFQQLMEGGIFGSSSSVFGTGVGAQYFGPMKGLNGISNFEASKDWLLKQYPGDSIQAKALRAQAGAGLFGVSMGQAEALMMMSPTDLGATQSLIGRAGLQMSDIAGSAYSGLAKIAGAKNMGDLSGVLSATLARGDIGKDDKDMINRAVSGGDFSKAQEALARVVGTHEQEKTEGAETRATIADLKNALTTVGADLLEPINMIRDAVLFMAGKDGWKPGTPDMPGGPGTSDTEIYGTPENKAAWGDKSEWQGSAPRLTGNTFSITDDQQSVLKAAANGDPWLAKNLKAWVSTENRGFGSIRNDARSPKGAFGAFQFMPDAWKDFGDGGSLEMSNFGTQATAAAKMLKSLHKKYGDNEAAIAAAINGGGRQAAYALAGLTPPAKETQDYLHYYLGNLNGAPTPDGGKATAAGPTDINLRLGGSGVITLTDPAGNGVGTAEMRAYQASQGAVPAGMAP